MHVSHLFETAAFIPLGDFVLQDYTWCIAGIFAFLGVILSFYNIGLHLAHWTRPIYQLWIVRVLFIIPIYATISFISIHESSLGLYMEIIRDCYEAFVIYCFLIWILNVIGGEEACAVSIAQRMSMKHPFPLCCLPPMRLNAIFLRTCKQMTLQFVILKPIAAIISFLLLVIGGQDLYFNPYWQLIMLTLYNVSYTLALYGLFLFYVATKDEMNSFSPVKKFLAVKAVVFMTYWQALFIPIIFGTKYSDKTNDFILCIETVFFAFMHYRAFPWWEFKYRKIPIDKVEYGFTNFKALEDEPNSPKDKDNISDFGYSKFSDLNGFGDNIYEEEKELEIDNKHKYKQRRKRSIDEPEISMSGEEFNFDISKPNVLNKRRRRSSENLAIITEEIITCRSWCNAFMEVINVIDVCNDAKKNFVS
eukprot:548480_1